MTDILSPGTWAKPRNIDLHDSDIAPELVETVRRNHRTVVDEHGLIFLEIELPRVSFELGVAGTPDRVAAMAVPGLTQPMIYDIKTSAHPERAETQREWALQMAVYQRCWPYSVADEKIIDGAFRVRRDIAVIEHIDMSTGAITLYRLDTSTAQIGIDAALARREWRRQTKLLTPIEIDDQAAGMTMEQALLDELDRVNRGPDAAARAAEILKLARHLGVPTDRIIDRARSIVGYGPVNGRTAFMVLSATTLPELRARWARLRQDGEADERYQRLFRRRAAELTGGAA